MKKYDVKFNPKNKNFGKIQDFWSKPELNLSFSFILTYIYGFTRCLCNTMILFIELKLSSVARHRIHT